MRIARFRSVSSRRPQQPVAAASTANVIVAALVGVVLVSGAIGGASRARGDAGHVSAAGRLAQIGSSAIGLRDRAGSLNAPISRLALAPKAFLAEAETVSAK